MYALCKTLLFNLLIVISLTGFYGCNTSYDGNAPGTSQEIKKDPGFGVYASWSMKDKFNIDVDQNGVVDQPQTRLHTHNLDDCPSDLWLIQAKNISTRGNSDVNPTLLSYEWIVLNQDNLPIKSETTYGLSDPSPFCLTEGLYTLHVSGYDPSTERTYYFSTEMTVENVTILVLGDDAAFGLAAPDIDIYGKKIWTMDCLRPTHPLQ